MNHQSALQLHQWFEPVTLYTHHIQVAVYVARTSRRVKGLFSIKDTTPPQFAETNSRKRNANDCIGLFFRFISPISICAAV